jgi:hypothetical protein
MAEMVKVEFSLVRLTEILKSLFFPLTAFELLDSLKRSGYSLLVRPPLPISPTHRAYISGRVAEKENCTIFVDPDRRFIGVEGESPQNVERIYRELVDIVRKRFELNFDEERNYLELVATGIVRSRHVPINVMADAFKVKVIEKVSEILGEDVEIYAVAFTPKGRVPSASEWFDIRIEPHIRLPTREYDLTVVYRSQNGDKVLKFFKGLESSIIDIIKTLEGGES